MILRWFTVYLNKIIQQPPFSPILYLLYPSDDEDAAEVRGEVGGGVGREVVREVVREVEEVGEAGGEDVGVSIRTDLELSFGAEGEGRRRKARWCAKH